MALTVVERHASDAAETVVSAAALAVVAVPAGAATEFVAWRLAFLAAAPAESVGAAIESAAAAAVVVAAVVVVVAAAVEPAVATVVCAWPLAVTWQPGFKQVRTQQFR